MNKGKNWGRMTELKKKNESGRGSLLSDGQTERLRKPEREKRGEIAPTRKKSVECDG